MTGAQLLLRLRGEGFEVSRRGPGLCIRYPRELDLPESFVDLCRRYKPELLRALDEEGEQKSWARLPLLPSGSPMEAWSGLPILTLDFETYFADDYKLEGSTVVSYIHDDRFHAHGLAVCHPDGRTEFRADVPCLLEELRETYGPTLERAVVVGHNLMFDYAVLAWRFGQLLTNFADTLLCAKLVHGADVPVGLGDLANRHGLHPKGCLDFMKGVRHPDAAQWKKLEAYACGDVEITSKLAQTYVPRILNQTPIECWAMQHSIRTYVERPLHVDQSEIRAGEQSLREAEESVLQACGHTREQISEDKLFVPLLECALRATGRSLPLKLGKKGPALAIAKGDPEQEHLMNDDDPRVRALMQAKATLRSTPSHRGRLKRIGAAAKQMGGRCPVVHAYGGAGTMRYTGGEGLSVQNLKDPDRGGTYDPIAANIRRALGAKPGHVFVSADASQIEVRVVAWLAGQADLHDALASGIDIYSEFGSHRFGREVRKPRPGDPPERAQELRELRQLAKQAMVGMGYGLGAEGLERGTKRGPLRGLWDRGFLTRRICADIVYGYRNDYRRIPAFWYDCEAAFRRAIRGVASEVGHISFLPAPDCSGVHVLLPSGRQMVYRDTREQTQISEPRTYVDRAGIQQQISGAQDRILYADGTDLYGGKIVENIVQATARDILVAAMLRLEQDGLAVVHHCHDSLTIEVPAEGQNHAAEALLGAWRTPPGWAAGLVLDAEAKIGSNLLEEKTWRPPADPAAT